jgi:hypothetical protein
MCVTLLQICLGLFLWGFRTTFYVLAPRTTKAGEPLTPLESMTQVANG